MMWRASSLLRGRLAAVQFFENPEPTVRKPRFSLRSLLALTASVALFVAGLSRPAPLMMAVLLAVVLVSLVMSTAVWIAGAPGCSAAVRGYASVGWLVFLSPFSALCLPFIVPWLRPAIWTGKVIQSRVMPDPRMSEVNRAVMAYFIAHCFWTVVLGAVGALVANCFVRMKERHDGGER